MKLLHADSPNELLAREGGGKARHMAALVAAGVSVPEWFCVPAAEFDRFCASAGVSAVPEPAVGAEEAYARTIEALIQKTPVPAELAAALHAELARLGLADALVAVRSSGLAEDSAARSYAGQFSSLLFQKGDAQILNALRACWASAFSARVTVYRRAAGDRAPPRMGVIVQRMVDSATAGVAFSRNPLRASDRATIVIESVVGQGEGLVSGELDSDRFEVDRASLVIKPTIANKTHSFVRDPSGGTKKAPLAGDVGARSSLTDEQVREVARLTLRLEHAMRAPQDVEWAWSNGALYCLQTRPITTLPPDGLFDAAVNGDDLVIWDNSNIIESFAGVTSPLTFTHVNRCYREVYLQYCRVMGVPENVITDSEPVFRNMLGLVRGRVYYNLVNWYRLLALFPGVGASKGFMETMMGVRQTLPKELGAVLDQVNAGPRYGAWRRLRVLLRSIHRLTRTQSYIVDFMRRVEVVYRSIDAMDLRTLNLSQQVAIYRRLETDVLMHWTAPIVNDTRCMVAFGVLGALTTRWLVKGGGDAMSSLRNDLLCGEGDLMSTEPTKLLMKIAERVDRDESVRTRFLAEPPDTLWASLQGGFAPGVRDQFKQFLDRFGFRCVNELKLEEPDLHDDPRFVVSTVQSFVRQRNYSITAMEEREAAIREKAEERVRGSISGLKRALYFRVVRWARRAVSDREMLRFERTRMFGVTRHLFRAIGANLVRLDLLDDERDVFHLTLEELMAFQEGRSLTTDFRAVAAARKREFDEFRRTAAPPDRFMTRGAAASAMRYPSVLLESDLLASASAGDDPNVLKGTPCSPGVVEGTVRVAHSLKDAEGIDKEILVTERTDPGWVPVFPACAGLIIERGSLLSHSAVVARELGIPTIVGVSGKPMQRLKTGQRVRMDASTGEIRIL